jgi:hypothetical protein
MQRNDYKCSHFPRTSHYNDTQATGFRYVTHTFIIIIIYRQTSFPNVTYRHAGWLFRKANQQLRSFSTGMTKSPAELQLLFRGRNCDVMAGGSKTKLTDRHF